MVRSSACFKPRWLVHVFWACDIRNVHGKGPHRRLADADAICLYAGPVRVESIRWRSLHRNHEAAARQGAVLVDPKGHLGK
eukprot:366216-Chlamydomonas_euryale.AAC.4